MVNNSIPKGEENLYRRGDRGFVRSKSYKYDELTVPQLLLVRSAARARICEN